MPLMHPQDNPFRQDQMQAELWTLRLARGLRSLRKGVHSLPLAWEEH